MSDQIYLLYHIRDDGQLLLVGIYRSEQEAKDAIERVKDKPGFIKYPKGFEYHAYELGVEIFGDGFEEENIDENEGEKKQEPQGFLN
jgi:hypothetical protein